MTSSRIRLAPDVLIDIAMLLATRAGVAANSGAGKSWILRLLAEQTTPHVPVLIFDGEGEFATLRERCDMVLVGSGGEVDTTIVTATKLMRKMIEMRLSAVVDMSDLSKPERQEYVKRSLESILSAPRRLWGPMLVIIDECQDYAPETGDPVSKPAVIDLSCKSRKHGIGCAYATQRLSKISKDAMGEANNLLIGRFAQDVDLRRASDLLGFSGKSEWATIRDGKPGEFFAVGPAFVHTGVKRFKCDPVTTTHARAGSRAMEPPKPSRAILKVAPELADLKRQVEEEKSELESLRAEVKQLRSAAKRPAASPARAAPPAVPNIDTSAYVLQGREDVCRMFAADLEAMGKTVAAAKQAIAAVERSVSDATRLLHQTRPKAAQLAKAVATAAKQTTTPNPKANGRATGLGGGWSAALEKQPADGRGVQRATSSNGSSEVSGGPKRILTVLAQHSDGLDPSSLRLFAQIGTKSSMRTYIGTLLARKHVVRDGAKVRITDVGLRALGPYSALPQGRALVDYWLDWVGTGGPRRILEAAIEAGNDGISKEDLLEVAAIGTASSLRTYVGTLQAARLIEAFREDGKSRIRAVASLLEAASA